MPDFEKPLWEPKREDIQNAKVTQFRDFLNKKYSAELVSYNDLHSWSIENIESFWSEVWDFCSVKGTKGNIILSYKNSGSSQNQMIDATWFTQAKLNYAENLLKFSVELKEQKALIFWGEDQVKSSMTWSELSQKVSQLQQAMLKMGVKKGDRIAGFLPNMPEAMIAMLAASSLGAIWSSASPDFGVQGVLDRFGQIEPTILFCCDGYFYNEKQIDCLDKNQQIVNQLSSIKNVVLVKYTGNINSQKFDSFLNEKIPNEHSHLNKTLKDSSEMSIWHNFDTLVNSYQPKSIEFTPVEFSHPLFIMFSSGTTGIPKCIVHSVGGTLIQHLKEHQLHANLQKGDRLFYFSTCGWMMWNWLASGLASGATLCLYDGSPFLHDGKILWDYLDSADFTHFGTSAKYIDACIKANLNPSQTHKLKSLKVILSTGSPLSPDGFDYVYKNIKSNVNLASISGGTDIISCFVLGSPILPVFRGEIQCKGLGMDVHSYDENEKSLVGEKGELVCIKPFPSMPIGFWNDPEGKKYHSAYFEKFQNIWCHGDFVEETKRGGYIIYGRSDATLNPGGVRIGTAEIYRQVEKLEEVQESIVIGQDWDKDVRVVLFVKLKEGVNLTENLVTKIKQTIRNHTTPRHVPSKVLQVKDIPRTKSGKIVELAVRQVVHGEKVKNIEALANPEALKEFQNRSELLK